MNFYRWIKAFLWTIFHLIKYRSPSTLLQRAKSDKREQRAKFLSENNLMGKINLNDEKTWEILRKDSK